MMISCKEATRLLSQGLDRRLPFGRRLSLRLHLWICDGCAHVGRQMAFLRKAVARLGDGRG